MVATVNLWLTTPSAQDVPRGQTDEGEANYTAYNATSDSSSVG
jgi:hypothetical protein